MEIRSSPETAWPGEGGRLEVRTVSKGKHAWHDFGPVCSWEYFLESEIEKHKKSKVKSGLMDSILRSLFGKDPTCEVLAEIPRLMLTFDESQVEVRDA